MIHLRYYSTGREDVLAARADDMRGNSYVEGRGQAFADLFNGIACFSFGFAPHFAGITFKGDKQPAKPSLWNTKHDPVLRVPKERGVHQKHMTESWELRRLWNEQFPHDIVKPRESKVLLALGLDLKAFEKDPFIEFFIRGEIAYIAADGMLQNVDEIKASEYLDAAFSKEVT